MKNILESKVETALDNGAKLLGGNTRKVKWLGRRGAPDRLVLLPCVRAGVFVELKRPRGGRLTKLQLREHTLLRDAGFDVRVLSSVEQVDAFYAEIIRRCLA